MMQHYQQPLELSISAGEPAFFVNSGTHTVYVTGNYVIDSASASDSEEDSDDDDEYGDYDLPPDMEDLIGSDSEDELDGIDGNGRVEEIHTDDEEIPQLVESKKGKNKRPAADGLDELIAKESKEADSKLSKKQAKKLKNNEGKAVAAEKETPKSEKKVQFAKNLEQGPTGSPAEKAKPADKAKKAAPTAKVVQGVHIDERKVGTGRTAKSGDKVGMRYIGKLENGKVFDCEFLPVLR